MSDLSGHKLTSDDIGCVLEELLDVSPLWYLLGVQLKVRTSTLDSIQAQFPDSKRQLLEMLKTWLTTNRSWKTLVDALRSRSVGASQLADDLETKYCLVERTKLDSGTFTSECQSETIVSPSAQPATSQLPASAAPPPPTHQSTNTGDSTPSHTPQPPTVTFHPLPPTPTHTGMSLVVIRLPMHMHGV